MLSLPHHGNINRYGVGLPVIKKKIAQIFVRGPDKNFCYKILKMSDSKIIISAEQLLAFCEVQSYRGAFFKYKCLTVNIQVDAPVLFVCRHYISHYSQLVCTTPEKLFLVDELYQAFLTLQRLPPVIKNKAHKKAVLPATYELDGSKFLAWLKSEVLLRKLRALLV